MKSIVLITGASRGIGAATARRVAMAGYAVCVNYHKDAEAARAVVNGIRAQGGIAMAVQGDVGSEADVVSMFKAIDQALGPVTALVNNAGILERQMRLDEMDQDRLGRVFGTNITGSFLCAREAVRRMSTRHGGLGGVIVNVSSITSRLGSPNEYIDYAATKGALDTMTIGLSREVADEGIRVNAVRPGIIPTDIHAAGGEPGRPKRLAGEIPMKRVGTEGEVADSILWLISQDASYVTGALLDVSGGR